MDSNPLENGRPYEVLYNIKEEDMSYLYMPYGLWNILPDIILFWALYITTHGVGELMTDLNPEYNE